MIIPPYLKTGDRIGIISPARKVKPEDLEEAQKIFVAWGLIPVLSKNLFGNEHGYLSGIDDQRLSDLESMMKDDSIKAIICARGGYGTTRILDRIKFDALRKSPKWIVGFSDITALHLKLFKEGFSSIHGTMPILFPKKGSQVSVEALRKLLFGEPITIEASGNKMNKPGNARGQIVGGNFSLFVDSLGTSNEVNTVGKILVLEEIDEYHYKIDRMLIQLKRASKLDDLAGLVIGHFTDIKDSDLAFGETVEEMILNHTREFAFPIGFNFPIGHENPNLPFIHGSTIELTVSNELCVLKPI